MFQPVHGHVRVGNRDFLPFRFRRLLTARFKVRVLLGEPFFRERVDAPHEFTRNAERESARRFFMRGRKLRCGQRVCDDGVARLEAIGGSLVFGCATPVASSSLLVDRNPRKTL